MMETAPSEDNDHDTCTCSDLGDQNTKAHKIFESGNDALHSLDQAYRDPAVMKFMAIIALNTLLDWHKGVAERKSKEANGDVLGWCADARSLEIAEDIITRINVGEHDFMTE